MDNVSAKIFATRAKMIECLSVRKMQTAEAKCAVCARRDQRATKAGAVSNQCVEGKVKHPIELRVTITIKCPVVLPFIQLIAVRPAANAPPEHAAIGPPSLVSRSGGAPGERVGPAPHEPSLHSGATLHALGRALRAPAILGGRAPSVALTPLPHKSIEIL